MKNKIILLSSFLLFSGCVSQHIPASRSAAKRKLARHYRAIERIDKVHGLIDTTRTIRRDTVVIQAEADTIRKIQWDTVRVAQDLDAFMDSLFSLPRSEFFDSLRSRGLTDSTATPQESFEREFRTRVIRKVIHETFPRDSLLIDNDTLMIKAVWEQGRLSLIYHVKPQEVVKEEYNVAVDTDPQVPFWQSNRPLWYLGLGSLALFVLYIWFGRYLHMLVVVFLRRSKPAANPVNEKTVNENGEKNQR